MSVIKIDDEIGYWGINSQMISRQLDEASGDITIEISSPGGAIFEGISIFNAIKSYDKGEVTTVITSLAASMASVIALAGDKVKAYDNSVYMIHNGSMGIYGDARFLRKKADHLESLTSLMANIYIAKTGKTEQEIKQLLDDETYFYGSEMLDHGFIDELIATDIGGDSESAKAIAQESFKSCMMHYKEKAKDEDTEQAAALLKTEILGVNREPTSAKEIKKNIKGESMSQKTYTEAEFKALEDANAEVLRTTTENAEATATASERERVSGIMALNGDNDTKMKAINDGLSIGETAIALNGVVAVAKTNFEDAAAELSDNNEQAPSEVVLSDEQQKEKEADEALAKLEEGKK